MNLRTYSKFVDAVPVVSLKYWKKSLKPSSNGCCPVLVYGFEYKWDMLSEVKLLQDCFLAVNLRKSEKSNWPWKNSLSSRNKDSRLQCQLYFISVYGKFWTVLKIFYNKDGFRAVEIIWNKLRDLIFIANCYTKYLKNNMAECCGKDCVERGEVDRTWIEFDPTR